MRVRDAVLGALVSDTNPGVRTQALHLLEPVKADSSVRAVYSGWRRTIRINTSGRKLVL